MNISFTALQDHEVAMEWISNRLKGNFPGSVFYIESTKTFWKRTKITVKLVSGEYDEKLIQDDIDECCYVASREHLRDGTTRPTKKLFGIFVT